MVLATKEIRNKRGGGGVGAMLSRHTSFKYLMVDLSFSHYLITCLGNVSGDEAGGAVSLDDCAHLCRNVI